MKMPCYTKKGPGRGHRSGKPRTPSAGSQFVCKPDRIPLYLNRFARFWYRYHQLATRSQPAAKAEVT